MLCFGGTKNGMAVGEAVVFFDRELAAEFDYRCKQAGQLASKMRFLAAPVGRDAAGRRLAAARPPRQRDGGVARARAARHPGVKVLFPVQANSVFPELPAGAVDALRAKGWRFYTFIGSGGVPAHVRPGIVTPEDVSRFAADLAAAT